MPAARHQPSLSRADNVLNGVDHHAHTSLQAHDSVLCPQTLRSFTAQGYVTSYKAPATGIIQKVHVATLSMMYFYSVSFTCIESLEAACFSSALDARYRPYSALVQQPPPNFAPVSRLGSIIGVVLPSIPQMINRTRQVLKEQWNCSRTIFSGIALHVNHTL